MTAGIVAAGTGRALAAATCAYQAGWRSRPTGPRLVGSRIGPVAARP
ncbi:hypothetical protein ACFVGM_38425 [Kitasatospora purpeofusca]